jgi:hypothetical protein
MSTERTGIPETTPCGALFVSAQPRLDALLSALRSSPYPPLRSVECCERGGIMRLKGSVPSYYLKQLAQSLALSIDETWLVQNEIEVVAPSSRFSLRGAGCGTELSEPRRPR